MRGISGKPKGSLQTTNCAAWRQFRPSTSPAGFAHLAAVCRQRLKKREEPLTASPPAAPMDDLYAFGEMDEVGRNNLTRFASKMMSAWTSCRPRGVFIFHALPDRRARPRWRHSQRAGGGNEKRTLTAAMKRPAVDDRTGRLAGNGFSASGRQPSEAGRVAAYVV